MEGARPGRGAARAPGRLSDWWGAAAPTLLPTMGAASRLGRAARMAAAWVLLLVLFLAAALADARKLAQQGGGGGMGGGRRGERGKSGAVGRRDTLSLVPPSHSVQSVVYRRRRLHGGLPGRRRALPRARRALPLGRRVPARRRVGRHRGARAAGAGEAGGG